MYRLWWESWGSEVVRLNGGRQWGGVFRSTVSGDILLGYVPPLWVLGLVGELVSQARFCRKLTLR